MTLGAYKAYIWGKLFPQFYENVISCRVTPHHQALTNSIALWLMY